MRSRKLLVFTILSLALLAGCSNQTSADIGNRIGVILGKPLGTIAAAGEQAFHTTGEIVAESVRRQRLKREVISNDNVEDKQNNQNFWTPSTD